MATVTFSAAGETLYAYLAGEIDHDSALNVTVAIGSPFPIYAEGSSTGGVRSFAI